jgi:hypothetical protein
MISLGRGACSPNLGSRWAGQRATLPLLLIGPLDRNRHTAASVAFPAPEAALQVEHAHRRRQPQPDRQANPRDQLVMPASDALDAQKIAVAKVFDPSIVQGSHRRRRVAVLFSDSARRPYASTWPSSGRLRFDVRPISLAASAADYGGPLSTDGTPVDLGALIGIVGLILAIPVGVMSHVLGHRFLTQLEKRKLVKINATRQQAIRHYNYVQSFHNRTRDRYPHYLLLAGWSLICAVVSSTSIILLVLIKPDIKLFGPVASVEPAVVVLIALAVAFALFAVLFLLALHDLSRRLDRFDEFRRDLEQQWGSPIDEGPEA